jgi:hypothetical protein
MRVAQYMTCANALTVGPGKSFSVYIGQGDFENNCITRQVTVLLRIAPRTTAPLLRRQATPLRTASVLCITVILRRAQS